MSGHTLKKAKKKAKKKFGTKPAGASASSCPVPLPKLFIHLDADRDGKVDDATSALDVWTPGKGKKGAIILVNNDDDDGKKDVDNGDQKVNSDDDKSDLAPLVIRRTPKDLSFPAGYKGYLRVNQEEIRIFDKKAAAGKEIIGPAPGPGKEYELPDLSFEEVIYGMEATEYPSRTFNGLIKLEVEVKDPKGASVCIHKAVVRVAPWIMPNHLDESEEVYVVDTGDNAQFLTDLRAGVSKGGAPAPRTHDKTDRWMQDIMEIGYATMPREEHAGDKPKWHTPSVIRTANYRYNSDYLGKFPKTKLLGKNYGYIELVTPVRGSSLNSYGNLECSPPVKVGKKEYKLGRIVYGAPGGTSSHRPMEPTISRFLNAQKVQEPFSIDTGWLIVGHVDEVLTFCPDPKATNKFKLVFASPRVAVALLKTLKHAGQGTAPMFQGIWEYTGTAGEGPLTFNRGVYRHGTVEDVLADRAFLDVQTTVQRTINSIEDVVVRNLGMSKSDIIRLPVLFQEDGGQYIAYTAGVANMLVVTRANKTACLCIPKPFGPVVGGACQFEVETERRLKPTGNDIQFVDDFVTYHQLQGEVHCGTNTKRKPPIDRFWWEQEGI